MSSYQLWARTESWLWSTTAASALQALPPAFAILQVTDSFGADLLSANQNPANTPQRSSLKLPGNKIDPLPLYGCRKQKWARRFRRVFNNRAGTHGTRR